MRALAGPSTTVVDLSGRRVLPGFIDHTHWHLPARRSARLDNSGSVEVIQQRLVEYARTLPAESWVVGRGWMPTDFPNRTADKRYLDAVFPDRPVVIRDRDGHQALANSRALVVAGVTRDTADPADGRIERDANGEPTGLLKEGAAGLVPRLLPSLDAGDTYQLLLVDNYIIGREKVIAFYHQLNQAYTRARCIYVVQDNWSIHRHPDVLEALKTLPRIQPVWLPTYSPWLNPIEKLWRWLRQDVLKMHRHVNDWIQVRQLVRAFLDQFARGSKELLHYVGLLGDGKLARALRPT